MIANLESRLSIIVAPILRWPSQRSSTLDVVVLADYDGAESTANVDVRLDGRVGFNDDFAVNDGIRADLCVG